MSGLLARLARHLAGPSLPTVRSRASLPYAPLPALQESPPMPAAPAQGAAATSAESAWPVEPAAAEAQAKRRATSQPLRPVATAPSPLFTAPPEAPAPLGRPPAALARRDESERADASVIPSGPSHAGTMSHAEARATAAEAPAPRSDDTPIPALDGESWRAPEALWPAARPGDALEAGTRRDPVVSSRRAPAQGGPSASGSAGGVAPAKGAPDEVHVHIGRIEVTAVVEPPAAPPRSRRGPAPMTLDDYLRRRGKEGA